MTLLKQVEIGVIPADWEIVGFSDAAEIRSGQVDPKTQPYYSMLHVGPENIESNTGRLFNVRTNEEERIISGNYFFTPEDVLYAKINPYLNKVALPNFEGTCSADMYPLKPRTGFERIFLYHLLLSDVFTKQSISFQDRTGIPKINRNQLGMISLPKPPLDEQRRIACVLSTVQTAIEQQTRLIALTSELKSALLRKFFTEGLRGEKQKQTEIGLVPESWEETTLGELAAKPDGRIQTGPFGSQLHKDEYTTEGIPVVNPTNLFGNRINHDDLSRIAPETAARLERHILQTGDILFARRGEIGRHGLATEKEDGWFCGTGSFLVRIKKPWIDNRFLYRPRRNEKKPT